MNDLSGDRNMNNIIPYGSMIVWGDDNNIPKITRQNYWETIKTSEDKVKSWHSQRDSK
jgi:hypothetical protein